LLWAAETLPATHADRAVLHPSAFVGIDPDGTVHLIAHRSEMGTSSRTSVPLILADELDADWKRVKLEQAIGDPRYGDQDTDGSHSIRSFYEVMREAGATARLMLTQAAAQQWKVPVSECQSDLHVIVHRKSNRKAGYGELATAAAKLPVPKKEELQFKPKSAWRYIGKGASSYDLTDICTGKAGYGMDARLDGMVYASVEHPPVLGGKVKSYDEKAPLQVRGVKQTIPIKPFTPPHHFQPLGGVAVIADNTWAAFQGRKKLNVAWDNGANASYDSDQYKKELQETARKPGQVARNIGDVYEGGAGCERQAHCLAAALGVSAHRFHVRIEHHLRRRRRTGTGMDRSALRHSQSPCRKWTGRKPCPYRLVPVGGKHLPHLRGSVVC
jgi:isoquinoline 1-oxidoreductase beta subunit